MALSKMRWVLRKNIILIGPNLDDLAFGGFSYMENL